MKRYYSPQEFLSDAKLLTTKIKKDFSPDAILIIARGGFSLGHILSEYLDIRKVYCINSIGYESEKKLSNILLFNIPSKIDEKNILIVDDIADSGETLLKVTNTLKERFKNSTFKTATLFYKKSSCFKPDFSIHEATSWIEFFWSKEYKDYLSNKQIKQDKIY